MYLRSDSNPYSNPKTSIASLETFKSQNWYKRSSLDWSSFDWGSLEVSIWYLGRSSINRGSWEVSVSLGRLRGSSGVSNFWKHPKHHLFHHFSLQLVLKHHPLCIYYENNCLKLSNISKLQIFEQNPRFYKNLYFQYFSF